MHRSTWPPKKQIEPNGLQGNRLQLPERDDPSDPMINLYQDKVPVKDFEKANQIKAIDNRLEQIRSDKANETDPEAIRMLNAEPKVSPETQVERPAKTGASFNKMEINTVVTQNLIHKILLFYGKMMR